MKEIKEKLFNDYVTMNGGDIISAEGGGEPEPELEQGTVLYANSCSYNDVVAAINQANVGDTIIVPDGEATWSQALIITKGIILKAATVGGVTITSGAASGTDYFNSANFLIAYVPAADQTDKPFRLSGFVLDGNSDRFTFSASNSYLTPVTQFRIDHCEIKNSRNSAMFFVGPIYGVVDNNVIRINSSFAIRNFGLNATSWENFTFDYGTANNLYYEDNTIYLPGGAAANEGGMGGRYCARHNTFYVSGTSGINPWFDMHGNMGTGGNHATMGAEIYENTIDAGGVSLTFFDHRGGKLIAFNNTASNVNGINGANVREEYLDSLNPPATGPTGQPQHVSDSYYWNHFANGAVRYAYGIGSTLDYGEPEGIVPRWDVHCFKHVATFDGSSGVGIGLLSARPATCTTEGVAWWATDENKLYRWHNGAWELYYTPYTYPHPLIAELGGEAPPPPPPPPVVEESNYFDLSDSIGASIIIHVKGENESANGTITFIFSFYKPDLNGVWRFVDSDPHVISLNGINDVCATFVIPHDVRKIQLKSIEYEDEETNSALINVSLNKLCFDNFEQADSLVSSLKAVINEQKRPKV